MPNKSLERDADQRYSFHVETLYVVQNVFLCRYVFSWSAPLNSALYSHKITYDLSEHILLPLQK